VAHCGAIHRIYYQSEKWGLKNLQDIFWIQGSPDLRLAIVMRPRGEDWLEHELVRMKQGGIETLVSMLEPFEAQWLGLSEEENTALRVGLEFLSYPITDTQVPADVVSFREFAADLASRLAAGQAIGFHCRGCIGRATVASACALIHLGWGPRRALEAIREARGVPVPDTPEQETWILAYRAQP
jgi:protein-tyrosine phosphatase